MKTGRDVRNNMSKAQLEKKRKELMESPIFKQAQKTLDNLNTHVQKNVKPILDRMVEAHKQISTPYFGDTSISIPVAPRETTQQEILKELRILNQKKIVQKQVASTEIVISYNSFEGMLTRIIDGKEYVYHFKNDTKRKKLFDTLRLKKTYLQRKELKVVLGSPTADAVSTMIKTFNDKVTLKLKLKIRLIVAKAGSGYRINPSVIIERA